MLYLKYLYEYYPKENWDEAIIHYKDDKDLIRELFGVHSEHRFPDRESRNEKSLWVNLRTTRKEDYCVLKGHRPATAEIVEGGQFQAAIGLQVEFCNRCGQSKQGMVVEGAFPTEAINPDLPIVEAELCGRSSLNRNFDLNAYILTSWSENQTGVLYGPSIEVRHCPTPPAPYTENVRTGQCLSTWAIPVTRLPVSYEFRWGCPCCKEPQVEINLKEILEKNT